MKSVFFTLLTLTAITLLLVPAGAMRLQEPVPPRPPSVPEESWIPLSDQAGILLTRTGPAGAEGRLVAEIDGMWVNVDLVADPRLRSLK